MNKKKGTLVFVFRSFFFLSGINKNKNRLQIRDPELYILGSGIRKKPPVSATLEQGKAKKS
jgi:hypothetical protein